MDGNYSQRIDDDVEIDIRDLFFYLLRHWRSLIIVIILGAFLGSGIYIAKKASFEKSAAATASQESWVETYQVAPEVRAKMDLAWQNRQAYEKQLSYNQNSLLMQMDAENVYTGKLKYYIAAGSSTRLLAEQFKDILNDSDLAEELKSAAGLECDAQYIQELIGCEVNSDNDSSVNISSVEGTESASAKNVVITYSVNSCDQETSEKMLAVIQEKADAEEQALQKKYGTFTCERLESSVVLTVNSSYLSQQKTSIDYLQTYANNFNSIENALDEKDLEYYQITYLNKETAESQPQTYSANKKYKWIVAGIFMLCCLWGIIFVLKYVLDKHIKTIDEVKTRYQLPVLGVLRISTKKKGIDKRIQEASLPRDMDFNTAEYMIQTLAILNEQKIMLCYDESNVEEKQVVEQMSQGCSALEIGGYLGKNADSLKIAKMADGMILAVTKEKTRYADIEQTLKLCSIYGVNVIGVLALA